MNTAVLKRAHSSKARNARSWGKNRRRKRTLTQYQAARARMSTSGKALTPEKVRFAKGERKGMKTQRNRINPSPAYFSKGEMPGCGRSFAVKIMEESALLSGKTGS